MPVVAVPSGVEDLTATWLTAALSEVADGARVEDLVQVGIAAGPLSEVVRLVPVWDRPTRAPGSLVVKVPSWRTRGDPVGGRSGAAPGRSGAAPGHPSPGQREVRFYRELAPSLAVSLAGCLGAHTDEPGGGYVVLLEDLAPAQPVALGHGCSPGEAASSLAELSILHASRWGDLGLLGLGWLDRPSPGAVRSVAGPVFSAYPEFVDILGPMVDPDVLVLAEALLGSLEAHLLDRPEPWTLVHGDLRPEHVMTGPPRPVLVDWKAVSLGAGISDVARFLGSAMDPERRARHERELVHGYHDHLLARSVELSWQDCWDGYRRYSLDGLLRSIVDAATGGRHQASTSRVLVERHGRQALELDAAEFLSR